MTADESGRRGIFVGGADRTRFLNGMCTANVEGIAQGGHSWALLLSAKGRVLSIFDIVPQDDGLLLLLESALVDTTIELLEKHAIMDDVTFEARDVTVHRVFPEAADVWRAPPVFSPAPSPSSAAAVEYRRIEAGWPRYGVDVDEKRFPFESPLEQFVDHKKGCYVGQEPVARVRDRGQAQKYLRGLRVLGGEGGVPVGAEVVLDKAVGSVSSAAVSPEFGSIALATLARKAWEPGTEVTVDGRQAVVVALPFAP